MLNKILCLICQDYICVITSDLKSNKEALLDGGGNVRARVRALEMKCSDCGVMWGKGPTWETSVIVCNS